MAQIREGPAVSAALTGVFSATIFLAAALLISIEPMVARMVLPTLGGTPAVWTTCMLFFQATLLAGYLYAHVISTRLPARAQVVVHLVVLALAFLSLPVSVSAAEASRLSALSDPTLGLLGLLVRTVGLPFFLLATTAPMLQRWYHGTGERSSRDPYFLYAASNAGGLAALVAYPVLIEPKLGLVRQAAFWAWSLVVLTVLVCLCAVVFLPRAKRAADVDGRELQVHSVAIAPREWLGWVLLSLIPSSLLLGVTAHLTTDLAAIPLLWVVPLALYFLSFIAVFAPRPWLTAAFAARCLPGLLMAMGVALGLGLVKPFLIPVHLLTFFVASVLCHGELARRRPPASGLTSFYLAIAVGGAAGGLFNALVAPLVFNRVAEYPIALVAAGLVLPFVQGGQGFVAFQRRDLILPAVIGTIAAGLSVNVGSVADSAIGVAFAMAVCGLTVLVIRKQRSRPVRFVLTFGALMAAGGLATAVTGRVLDQERDFFGVLKVTETPDGKAHRLFHGSTLHGQQSLVPDLRRDPLTYYSSTGPVGDIFRELPARREGRAARVAVAGMGVGTLAAYAAPGDRWTFLELDPAVVRIARDARYFTYVSDCPAKSLDVVVGDARLGLARTPDSGFDLILLDAFSSDSIPVHLITREALGIYRRKLAPGGWLVFNITNRYLDLASVLALLADDAGLACRVRVDHRPSPVEAATGLTGSDWAVLATSEADLGALGTNAHWLTPSPITGDRVWTDDFSNIFTHFFMRKIDARPSRNAAAPTRYPALAPARGGTTSRLRRESTRSARAGYKSRPVGLVRDTSDTTVEEACGQDPPGPEKQGPAPDAEPVACDSLEQLLDHPAEFAGKRVVPDGLYTALGTESERPGGPVSVRLARATIEATRANLGAFRQSGSVWSVAVDPVLATKLTTVGIARNPPRVLPRASARNSNAAVLTFRVFSRKTSGGRRWEPQLVRAEFVVGMNYARLAGGLFKGSVRTLTVSTEPGKQVALSPRDDWSKRLGTTYLAQLRPRVRQERSRQRDRAMERVGELPEGGPPDVP